MQDEESSLIRIVHERKLDTALLPWCFQRKPFSGISSILEDCGCAHSKPDCQEEHIDEYSINQTSNDTPPRSVLQLSAKPNQTNTPKILINIINDNAPQILQLLRRQETLDLLRCSFSWSALSDGLVREIEQEGST